MSFQADANLILEALNDFYERSVAGEGPVIRQPPMSELIASLQLAELVREGGLTGEKLTWFMDEYLSGLTRFYHPANIAHQQAVPHYMAALAGLVDHFVSSDGSIYEFGPASVSLEYFLINWLLEKVGWVPAPLDPQLGATEGHGGGILTHGGSLANLTALIAARSKIAPDVWAQGNPGNLALLAPAEAHYSISRAAGIMGIGSRSIYPLETDAWGVIKPDRLPAAHTRVEADGKQVIALIADACNTAAGLYDPLQEIGAFCRERGLWFHVDGAHGAPALLTEKYRHLMRGVELADSLTMNMHKLMRVTALCTALLVREARTLDQAFTQEASYLFFAKEQPGFDFIHRTIECTKPVQGLKFFMVLAAMGEAGMAAYIERQFDLAVEAYHFLCSLPDFECPVEPQSNILCFRVKGIGDGHLALRDKLLARGNYYVSTTSLNGQRCLRLTLTNPATTLEVIKGLVHEIRETVAGGRVGTRPGAAGVPGPMEDKEERP
ncbi:MAG: pyridoxal phosphate-dependent decarboxylase family protein [Anaerolineae bacterium]